MTRVAVALVPIVLSILACKGKESPSPAPTPSASAAPNPTSAVSKPAAPTNPVNYLPGRVPIPTGPRLAIQPGLGVGTIRFGATVETIERHMQKPCDYRDENSCRYVSRATEFYLKNGVVNEIRIHRLDRPAAPKPRIYGAFNGGFPEGAQFGMFQPAVVELLGKPKKSETLKTANEAGTVQIDHYANMRLEYDRIENGNVVLGGVVLLAP